MLCSSDYWWKYVTLSVMFKSNFQKWVDSHSMGFVTVFSFSLGFLQQPTSSLSFLEVKVFPDAWESFKKWCWLLAEDSQCVAMESGDEVWEGHQHTGWFCGNQQRHYSPRPPLCNHVEAPMSFNDMFNTFLASNQQWATWWRHLLWWSHGQWPAAIQQVSWHAHCRI